MGIWERENRIGYTTTRNTREKSNSSQGSLQRNYSYRLVRTKVWAGHQASTSICKFRTKFRVANPAPFLTLTPPPHTKTTTWLAGDSFALSIEDLCSKAELVRLGKGPTNSLNLREKRNGALGKTRPLFQRVKENIKNSALSKRKIGKPSSTRARPFSLDHCRISSLLSAPSQHITCQHARALSLMNSAIQFKRESIRQANLHQGCVTFYNSPNYAIKLVQYYINH